MDELLRIARIAQSATSVTVIHSTVSVQSRVAAPHLIVHKLPAFLVVPTAITMPAPHGIGDRIGRPSGPPHTAHLGCGGEMQNRYFSKTPILAQDDRSKGYDDIWLQWYMHSPSCVVTVLAPKLHFSQSNHRLRKWKHLLKLFQARFYPPSVDRSSELPEDAT
jgi:hypothetical protein